MRKGATISRRAIKRGTFFVGADCQAEFREGVSKQGNKLQHSSVATGRLG